MAQFHWTYLSDTGKQHLVGLFHGDQTGHVMVHCNSQVIVIDFHVLQSKNYSFFIEDELCEIKLERKNNGFSYGFDINRRVDTPLNRERRATERRHLRLGLLLTAGFALAVALVVFGLTYKRQSWEEKNRTSLLAGPTLETIARVSVTNSGDTPQPIAYSFVADGKRYGGRSDSALFLPEGIRIETGDEFLIRYVPNAPQINQIDFSQPTAQQILRYRQRVFSKHSQLHADLGPARINCVLDVLYEVAGLSAFADVLYQQSSPQENAAHNRQTYQELIERPDVVERLSERCR